MRATITSGIPQPVKNAIRPTVHRVLQTREILRDGARFRGHFSRDIDTADLERLESRLIFHAHSLEKGLSHTQLRPNFGTAALTALAATLAAYDAAGGPHSRKAFTNAISVLREYVDVHRELGADIPLVEESFAPWWNQIESDASQLGGTLTVRSADKVGNRTKGFAELFGGRVSVREYADSPVDIDLLEEAISIATKSPSVCNRQPYRVRAITDAELIKQLLDAQGGFTGYAMPPALLIITTDIRAFVGWNERNQVYVDGGIFSMALLMALEYVGLAACPLNTMFTRAREERVRSIVGEDHEAFIMFVSVGNFPEVVKEPKSFRYSAAEISLPPPLACRARGRAGAGHAGCPQSNASFSRPSVASARCTRKQLQGHSARRRTPQSTALAFRTSDPRCGIPFTCSLDQHVECV